MLRGTRPGRTRPPRSAPLRLRRKTAQVRSNLITDPAECAHWRHFGTLCGRRVLEILMEPVRVAGKDRAGLLRVIAHRQHVVELLSRKLIDRFGPVAGNIDAQLLHDGDRSRPYLTRLRSGAFDLEAVAFIVA